MDNVIDIDIDIEWVDAPPPAKTKSGKRAAFLAALQTRPGQWAKYPNKGGTGLLKAELTAKGLEQVSRSGVSYLRYVGK